jgi:hypothetical protein
MAEIWYSYSGNMHVHTRYSDGEKWHAEIAKDAIAAGLDFVLVTDHNVWVSGVEGYYENQAGRVLLLTGEEVHHVRRDPQANHFLAYGAERELAGFAEHPQRLIDETITAGGIGFLAHPHERDLPLIHSPDLGWHDWDIEGFTGLEIWNYMSSFKNVVADRLESLRWRNKLLSMWIALRMTLYPERHISAPDSATLAVWDDYLSRGLRVSAVGNSDAHGTPMKLGPIRREIFPYDFLFRAVNTHILVSKPLNGDPAHDKRQILRALGQGNSWVGYDMPASTVDFRFTVQGVNKGVVGDEMPLGTGATLQVRTPARCRIRIVRHGEVVSEVERESNLAYMPHQPGAYRVECYIPYEGRERGWIFSNPIYLR